MKNRNQLILFGYLAFFFVVVSFYDIYKENIYLVALAAVILLVAGLVAWVWSVQGRKDKGDQ